MTIDKSGSSAAERAPLEVTSLCIDGAEPGRVYRLVDKFGKYVTLQVDAVGPDGSASVNLVEDKPAACVGQCGNAYAVICGTHGSVAAQAERNAPEPQAPARTATQAPQAPQPQHEAPQPQHEAPQDASGLTGTYLKHNDAWCIQLTKGQVGRAGAKVTITRQDGKKLPGKLDECLAITEYGQVWSQKQSNIFVRNPVTETPKWVVAVNDPPEGGPEANKTVEVLKNGGTVQEHKLIAKLQGNLWITQKAK